MIILRNAVEVWMTIALKVLKTSKIYNYLKLVAESYDVDWSGSLSDSNILSIDSKFLNTITLVKTFDWSFGVNFPLIFFL